MARKTYPEIKYETARVWAAAAAADRANQGNYVSDKTAHMFYERTEDGDIVMADNYTPKMQYARNKEIFKHYLTEQEPTAEDYAAGESVRNYIKTFTLRFLTGKISAFEKDAIAIAEKDEWTSKMYLQLGAVVYYPSMVRKDRIRQEAEQKAAFADHKHIGTIDSRVTIDVEVLKCFYSEKWGTYFVSAIADSGIVRFAFRKALNVGEQLNITGTVKAHDEDGTTKLNRVKINKG